MGLIHGLIHNIIDEFIDKRVEIYMKCLCFPYASWKHHK